MKRLLRRKRALARLNDDISMYKAAPPNTSFVNRGKEYSADNKLEKALVCRQALLNKRGVA